MLERSNPGHGVTLHIVDEVVHDSLDGGCRGQVRSIDSLLDRKSAAVGIGTDHVRFDRLILSVDQDLLPRGERSVKGIVASIDRNTVVVELLDLFDGRQLSG